MSQSKNLSCRLFGHRWSGCKCARCGELRDEGHSWSGCKCSVCGKKRDQDHNWVSASWKNFLKYTSEEYAMSHCPQVCKVCGKTRMVEHNFAEMDGCFRKCTKCGYETKPAHVWDGCTCLACGATRDEGHSWVRNGCEKVCSVCGKTRTSDRFHEWTQGGCDEVCANCGKLREKGKYHDWVLNGCTEKCSRCGEEREKHDFQLLRHDVSYGTGTCSTVYASDDYACNFCKTPDACLKYPRTDSYVYKCSRCGTTKTQSYEGA